MIPEGVGVPGGGTVKCKKKISLKQSSCAQAKILSCSNFGATEGRGPACVFIRLVKGTFLLPQIPHFISIYLAPLPVRGHSTRQSTYQPVLCLLAQRLLHPRHVPSSLCDGLSQKLRVCPELHHSRAFATGRPPAPSTSTPTHPLHPSIEAFSKGAGLGRGHCTSIGSLTRRSKASCHNRWARTVSATTSSGPQKGSHMLRQQSEASELRSLRLSRFSRHIPRRPRRTRRTRQWERRRQISRCPAAAPVPRRS